MNHLEKYTRSTSISFDEDGLKELQSEVKKGNYNRIQFFVKLFSLNLPHPFLAQSPDLAAKLSKLFIKKSKSEILDKDQVAKCISLFKNNNVFSSGKISETVKILCRDGFVELNKQLLWFGSEFFRARLTSPFEEKEKDRSVCEIDYSKDYQMQTILLLKEWLYNGKLENLQFKPSFESIRVAVEFLSFVNYTQIPISKDEIVELDKKLKNAIIRYKVENDSQLEEILRLLQNLVVIDQKYISYAFSALEGYIGCPLDIKKHAASDDFYVLSIDQISLLDSSVQGLQEPLRGSSEKKEPVLVGAFFSQYNSKHLKSLELHRSQDNELTMKVYFQFPQDHFRRKRTTVDSFKNCGVELHLQLDERVRDQYEYAFVSDQKEIRAMLAIIKQEALFSDSDYSFIEKEIEKHTAVFRPTVNSPVIAKFLSEYVKGVFISKTSQLDVLSFLSFSKNEALKECTYVLFDCDLEKSDIIDIFLQSVSLAFPQLKTLKLFASNGNVDIYNECISKYLSSVKDVDIVLNSVQDRRYVLGRAIEKVD